MENQNTRQPLEFLEPITKERVQRVYEKCLAEFEGERLNLYEQVKVIDSLTVKCFSEAIRQIRDVDDLGIITGTTKEFLHSLTSKMADLIDED